MVSPQDAGTNLYEQSNAAYRRNDKTAGRRLLNAAFDVNRDLPGPWYQLAVVATSSCHDSINTTS